LTKDDIESCAFHVAVETHKTAVNSATRTDLDHAIETRRQRKEGLDYLAAKSDTMSSGDSSKKEAKAQTEGETFKGSISGAVSTRKALRGRQIPVLIAPTVLSCTDIQDMSSNL
jgi:hypothetical protein